jgi:hypothetical protein
LGRKLRAQYLQVYLESPAQSFSIRGYSLVTFGQKIGKESTVSSGVPGESSPNTFHERRQVITFGQKVGKEYTVSSDVLSLESPAQLFSTRGDRLVTFGQKVGKESTVSSGIPGESSPIIFHAKSHHVRYTTDVLPCTEMLFKNKFFCHQIGEPDM